jgi:hypothetical protein
MGGKGREKEKSRVMRETFNVEEKHFGYDSSQTLPARPYI